MALFTIFFKLKLAKQQIVSYKVYEKFFFFLQALLTQKPSNNLLDNLSFVQTRWTGVVATTNVPKRVQRLF